MRKFAMCVMLVLGLAVSAQAVQVHNFNLNGPEGWGDVNLTSYVNTYLNSVLVPTPDPLVEFGFLGKLDSNGTVNGLTVDGLGSTSGTWSYDGVDSIVAYVLKGGDEGGWLVYNDNLLPVSLLPLGSAGDWVMPSQQELSHFAAFTGPGEPSQRQDVPEPGSTIASLLAGIGFLAFARRKFVS